jgi:hypothetical protein
MEAAQQPAKKRRVTDIHGDEAVEIIKRFGLPSASKIVLIGSRHYTREHSESLNEGYYASVVDGNKSFWSAQEAYNDELVDDYNLKQEALAAYAAHQESLTSEDAVREAARRVSTRIAAFTKPQQLVAAAEEEPKQEDAEEEPRQEDAEEEPKQEDAEIVMEEEAEIAKEGGEEDKDKEAEELLNLLMKASEWREQADTAKECAVEAAAAARRAEVAAAAAAAVEGGDAEGAADEHRQRLLAQQQQQQVVDEQRQQAAAASAASASAADQPLQRQQIPCICGRKGALSSAYCISKLCGDCCKERNFVDADSVICKAHRDKAARNADMPRVQRGARRGWYS